MNKKQEKIFKEIDKENDVVMDLLREFFIEAYLKLYRTGFPLTDVKVEGLEELFVDVRKALKSYKKAILNKVKKQ